jgi:DNA-binding PadR family transcriptional regulator
VLTELEGAILSEIYHRGQKTAFQVRRAFAASPSLEWKGSAGAVYPAVKRLELRGYILASAAQGGRGTRQLSLSEEGRKAMMAWACDPARAASVGIDPFRLRSGIWAELTLVQRRKLFNGLRVEIEADIARLAREHATTDPVERVRVELALSQQRDRLKVLARWET